MPIAPKDSVHLTPEETNYSPKRLLERKNGTRSEKTLIMKKKSRSPTHFNAGPLLTQRA